MSEPAAVDVRPVRLTRVCRVLAVLLLGVFTLVGVTLNVGGAQVFGLADSIAMIVLGVMLAAIVLGFTRARVQADTAGLRIRGGSCGPRTPVELSSSGSVVRRTGVGLMG